MCIDFAPGFQNTFHSQIVPALLEVMADSDNPRYISSRRANCCKLTARIRTQGHAAAAMLNYASNVHKDILRNYLDPLLSRLLEMLRVGGTHVQEQALSCIAAVAESAREHFAEVSVLAWPNLRR